MRSRPSLFLAFLAAALLALPLVAQASDPGDAPAFTFSEGPFERAWALVDTAQPATPPAAGALPPADASRRDTPQVWERWATSVRAAADAEHAPDARLWLAAFAREQGRFDDAWDHLAHALGDDAGLRATLPLMVPGVAPDALASWPALPDALLTPALPPPDRPAGEVLLGTGRLRNGSARVEGFRVGDARVALSIRVEGDGVQIDLEHLGGGPAHVRVLLPEPPDFELRSEYLDWGRLDGVRVEREIELVPGGETRTLFGRYQVRRLSWPTLPPPGLNMRLERDGLQLVAAPGSSLAGLAAGLGRLLDLRVEAIELAPEATLPGFGGVQVDLREADTLAAKRAATVSIAERFVLARPR